MPGENILQTIQKITTVSQRVDQLKEDQLELRATMTARVERLEALTADLRERVARLEASREGDRAQLQADLARFMIEVERAELRRARRPPPADAPALPPESEGGAGA